MMNLVAFVPASEEGNKIPKSNFQSIGELPLFLRASYNLAQILDKKQIVIDSDDNEILELAKNHGFNTLIKPPYLEIDPFDYEVLFKWETSNFPKADVYFQLLPLMPFLSKNTLEQAIQFVTTKQKDSILSVYKKHSNLFNFKNQKTDDNLHSMPNSYIQDDSFFYVNGLYAITKKAHEITGRRIGNNYALLEIPKIEQFCIDNMEDLELARTIEFGLPAQSSYKSKNLLLMSKMKYILNARAIICDVDGVLTDGKMIYSENGDQLKNFNTRDGIAVKMLKDKNIKLALFSSSTNIKLIQNRGEYLGFDIIDVGLGNKLERIEKIKNELCVSYEEIIYIGDDINDLEAMAKCKICICPNDAHNSVKNNVDWVLNSKGGEGCLREVSDFILSRIK